jgi:acetyltransferase-like isoleucine patch superfamily enzyme
MSNSLRSYWEYFLSLPKTFIFNFRYFPFKTALKFPVLISHRVLLRKMAGSIELGRIKTGIVKIGFGNLPLFDCKRERSVLFIDGKIIFKGSADFGPGCRVGIYGELECGDQFVITARGMISAKKKIQFGKNVMISWDVSVIDHDYHWILGERGEILNPAKPVSIGDDVWIGFECAILKGCRIPSGVIVAARTTATGYFEESNSIIGQQLNFKNFKQNVVWKK